MTVLERSVTATYPRWVEPPSSWQRSAACRGMDVVIFFPEGGDFTAARAVCSTCLVVAECRRATDRTERGAPASCVFGYVGAESPSERVERRRAAV